MFVCQINVFLETLFVWQQTVTAAMWVVCMTTDSDGCRVIYFWSKKVLYNFYFWKWVPRKLNLIKSTSKEKQKNIMYVLNTKKENYKLVELVIWSSVINRAYTPSCLFFLLIQFWLITGSHEFAKNFHYQKLFSKKCFHKKLFLQKFK